MSTSSGPLKQPIMALQTLALVFFFTVCSPVEMTPDAPAAIFSEDLETVIVEIDYQQGAAPYTFATQGGFPGTYSLFLDNVRHIFSPLRPAVALPTTLEGMEEIPISGESFSSTEIRSIAAQHRDQSDGPGVRTFYVVFLDGYFRVGEAVESGTFGVTLKEERVIALFKPVFEALDTSEFATLKQFAEQMTLIHEFGHAIGLVGDGLDPIDDHHDVAHGAHCANSECIMHHTLEANEAIADFVSRFMVTQNTVVFGRNCVQDIRAATPGGHHPEDAPGQEL